MVNIVEELITTKIVMESVYDDVIRQLAGAELFIADNVLEYYWDKSLVKDEWDWTDFPNIAPPFREFFVGFNRWPRTVDITPDSRWYTARGGVYFSGRSIADAQDPAYIDLLTGNSLSRASLRKDGVKWILYATPLRFHQKRLMPPMIRYVLPVQEDGVLYDHKGWGTLYDVSLAKILANHHGAEILEAIEGERHVCDQYLTPALITISMLHCRNVTTIDNRLALGKVGKKPKLKRAKGGGSSGQIKFKTIQIEPILKRILENEGRVSEVGILQALHTCRGHFKDYRHGSGLFGKHKEIYWWDAHERGSEDAGIIIKDYELAKLQ